MMDVSPVGMNQNRYFSTPQPNHPSIWTSPFSKDTNTHSPSRGGYSMLGNDQWRQKVDHLKKFFGDEYDPRKQFHSQASPFNQKWNSGQGDGRQYQKYQHSYSTMLENALQKNSIHERCAEVTNVLSMASVTDLRELYPTLLLDIFGYQSLPSWGLNYLEPRSYSTDFNAMVRFLGPKGTIFKLIDKLMTDHDAVFQAPYEILPSGICESIMKNQIPPWYQHKITHRPNGSVVVTFNALEYYFALFAYFVLHQRTLELRNDWTGIEDVFYVHIFEAYLKEYLPLYNTAQPTSPIASVSPSSVLKQHGAMRSSLWRSPDMTSMTQTPTTPLNHFDPHEPSKAETFLQIITDFWLAFNSEEYIQRQEEYKLPSLDHSRMVRILIKYLHTFTNLCKKSDGVQTFGTNPSALRSEDLEKVIIPSTVHDKLYSYLLHCFNHWPLDGTFRMILETWLSFIQPWRYQDNQVNVSTDDFNGDLSNWKNFIQSNMHFYSGLLSVFLMRTLKYDLMALEDVQLIYRVAKVISQPCLMNILHEGLKDGGVIRKGISPRTTPDVRMTTTSDGLFNLSASPSVFTVDNNRHAKELCQRISTTLLGIRHKILVANDNKTKKRNSWIGYIRDILMMDDYDDVYHQRDQQRLVDYLEHSRKALSTFFELSDFPSEATYEGDITDSGSRIPTPNLYNDDSVPDHRVTENGIELTDRGRYQMIQGMRRFDVVYSGDPEYQPLRSFESPRIVRLFHRISTLLNAKYGGSLETLYNRQDIIGKMLRRISQKGLERKNYANSAIRIPASRNITPGQSGEVIKPRITLRFAGSYYFLGYICWGIVLCRLFDFSWLAIILIVLLVVFVSTIYHIDNKPSLKND